MNKLCSNSRTVSKPGMVEQCPLHLAAGNGHVDSVIILLDYFDANISSKDSDGNTALHRVVQKPLEKNSAKDLDKFYATALALVKHHISLNEANNKGETALHLSATNRFPKIAQMLLSAGAISRPGNNKVAHSQVSSEEESMKGMSDENETVPSSILPHPSNSTDVLTPGKMSTNYVQETSNETKHVGVAVMGGSKQRDDTKLSKDLIKPSADQNLQPLHEQNIQQKPRTNKHQTSRNEFEPCSRYVLNIDNEISSFSVTEKKGAERMCILFDKSPMSTTPGTKRSQTSKKGCEREAKSLSEEIVKTQNSADSHDRARKIKSTDPMKTLQTSVDESTGTKVNLENIASKDTINHKDSEITMVPTKADKITTPKKTDDVFRQSTNNKQFLSVFNGDYLPEYDDYKWITHKVQQNTIGSSPDPKDREKLKRNRSKSPAGFLSEGGGLRGVRMRVAGEVPKAYTRNQKDSARRAFFMARPVGIESVSDDRTHLSMTSLPEIGYGVWEKAMQRRMEWLDHCNLSFLKLLGFQILVKSSKGVTVMIREIRRNQNQI